MKQKPAIQTKKQMEKLNFSAISRQLVPYIERILKRLRISYLKSGNKLVLSCPIHDSTNESSLNIFLSGQKGGGNYICWTKHCEQEHGASVIFLIKAILEREFNHRFTIEDTLEYIESDVKIERDYQEPE